MKLSSPLLKRRNRHVPVTAEQVDRYQIANRVRRPGPGSAFLVGDVPVIENWLEIPIGDGWIAGYRLVHSGKAQTPRTRILEVRIFPDEGNRSGAPGGEWSAAVLGDEASAPTPFSFDRLRRGVTEKAFDSALQAVRANLESKGSGALSTFDYPATRRHVDEEGKGAGRPGFQRGFYAQLAVRYDALEHSFRREPGTSTRQLLREKYYPKASLAAIAKWLTTARRQGFLTRVERGQRGSRATDLARQFVHKSKR